MRARTPNRDNGVIAMMTVIIIGAMIMAAGISAAFLGQTETILLGQVDREYIARKLATACVEEATFRLKLDASYTGGTVPVGTGSCSVSVAGSGASRTITASASSAEFTKTIVVGLSLKQNAALTAQAWHIDSWTEGDPP